MARFAGLVGFVHTVRQRPGVSQEVVTEKGPYYGDVKRAARQLTPGVNVNPELSTTNTIEIVADDYASENIFAIRFVEWAGTAWIVVEATVQRPRLLLRLGGVYRGARAEPIQETSPADGS